MKKAGRRKLIGDTLVDGDWPYFLQAPFIRRERGGPFADEPLPVDADEWARQEKAKNDRQRDDFILAVGKVFRQRHPDESARWIAPRAHRKVNDLLRARKKQPIKQSTVYTCLRKNWARIAPKV